MQNNRLLFPERFIPTQNAIPPKVLPPRIHELARTCFGPGHRDTVHRPSAQMWADELDRAGWELMGCRESDRHLYHNSLTSCVWCEHRRAGHGDHYPPSAMPKIVIPPVQPPVRAAHTYPLPPVPPVTKPVPQPAAAAASGTGATAAHGYQVGKPAQPPPSPNTDAAFILIALVVLAIVITLIVVLA
jgi:hypothetical protein